MLDVSKIIANHSDVTLVTRGLDAKLTFSVSGKVDGQYRCETSPPLRLASSEYENLVDWLAGLPFSPFADEE